MLDSDYGATKRLGGVASSPRPFTPVWLAQEEAGQKKSSKVFDMPAFDDGPEHAGAFGEMVLA
jgi:hypothetical protein